MATMERLPAEGGDSSQSVERLPVLTEPSRSGSPPGGVHRHHEERPHELLPLVQLQAVEALPEVGAPLGSKTASSGLPEKNWRKRVMLR
jgi:hypothetical protein